MSRLQRYRSPSDRRLRRSSRYNERSSREPRRDMSSRSRRTRSLSPNYYSSAEKFRSRRRYRRYSSGSDGIHSNGAARGRSSSQDLNSDRYGSYKGGRRRRRRGERGNGDQDEIKNLIIKFFDHFSTIYKMVKMETKLIKKQSCMESRTVKKYYSDSHALLPKLDESLSPQELLRTVSKEAALVGDSLNKKFRESFFEHHSRDEWDRSGHQSSRKSTQRKDYRDDGYHREDRRRNQRSYRRREPQERRDRYERRSGRSSRRNRRDY